jgi:hypothetical protein
MFILLPKKDLECQCAIVNIKVSSIVYKVRGCLIIEKILVEHGTVYLKITPNLEEVWDLIYYSIGSMM